MFKTKVSLICQDLGIKPGIQPTGYTELLNPPSEKGNWRQDVCESLKLHSCDYLLQPRCPELGGMLAPLT